MRSRNEIVYSFLHLCSWISLSGLFYRVMLSLLGTVLLLGNWDGLPVTQLQ